jgi:3-hydroxyacyl-CoA dehydrogenase/enoyl-CoA hydratase/3-hydroxybutyryl-CoA epimerase
MGPIELADTVGLDIAMAAGKQLAGGAAPPHCLLERVERQEFGKKSGQGFYRWADGKPVKGSSGGTTPKVGPGGTANAALAESLANEIVAAAQRLVDQGIVADADLADAGVIFGTGFAPFTGGPLNYLNNKESKERRST